MRPDRGVKWAEKEEALVLRLVEFRGWGGDARLHLPGWVKKVQATNLLERQAPAVRKQAGLARIALRPWEIATVKLIP